MSHPTDCPVCAAIVPSLSNVENGNRLDVSEATIRRHKNANQELDSFFGIPNEIITSRGKTVRLGDGSYEKVTYSPAKAALLETLKYDDIEQAIEGFDYKPSFARRIVVPLASTLHAADLQVGKADQRGGGTPDTIKRVMNSFHEFAEYCKEVKPSHIVLSDNGDSIENCFNVPQQLVTNDLDVPAQIRTFRRLMIEGIKLLAPLSPHLTYVGVPSNHGAFRTGYKSPGGTTDADFGLEILEQLRDVCAEHPVLKDVEFVRPDPLYEVAEVTAGDTKLAYHHGHQSAGPNAHSKWWSGLDHGRLPGWDADILVTAHFHSLRVEQSGDERWIIGVSSSEPSSDWYTNKTGSSSKRGITSFDVRAGEWSNLRIL